MSKHEHGKMDIEDQKKTFGGFVTFLAWLIGINIVVLIFLAIFNS